MSFRVRPRSFWLRPTLLASLSAIALLAAVPRSAQARDFEMGGDGNYSIMAPEPGTGAHHVARSRHGRTSLHQSKSLTATQKAGTDTNQNAAPAADTPEQIEAYKRNRRAFAARGSSGLVLPTPLPGPTHYAPIGTPAAPPLYSVQDQPPTILPGSGRAIPNLPHGPETFQDRASRCAYQSAINGIHAGQLGSYMQNCAM
jgi:hypothetical protein